MRLFVIILLSLKPQSCSLVNLALRFVAAL